MVFLHKVWIFKASWMLWSIVLVKSIKSEDLPIQYPGMMCISKTATLFPIPLLGLASNNS